MKSTGDGHLATFDDPSSAVAAACSLVRELEGTGLTIRAGLHVDRPRPAPRHRAPICRLWRAAPNPPNGELRPPGVSALPLKGRPSQDLAVEAFLSPREVDVPVVELARLQPLIGEQRFSDLMRKQLVPGRRCGVAPYGTSTRRPRAAEWPRCCRCSSATSSVPAWRFAGSSSPATPSSSRSPSASTTASTVLPGDAGALGDGEADAYERCRRPTPRSIAATDPTRRRRPPPRSSDRRAGSPSESSRCRRSCGDAMSAPTTRTSGPTRPGPSSARIWRPVTASCSPVGRTCQPGSQCDRVSIIPPSIDPFSPKNQELSEVQRLRILAAMGVLDGRADRSGDLHPSRRHGGSCHPASVRRGRGTPRSLGPPRDPGVAMGPPEGHGRRHGRLRGAW